MTPCETPDKCRIQHAGPSMTTMVYYPPIFDGHGNNLNPDRNTTTTPMCCATCGKEWVAETGPLVAHYAQAEEPARRHVVTP